MIHRALQQSNINARLVNSHSAVVFETSSSKRKPKPKCTIRQCLLPNIDCTASYAVYQVEYNMCNQTYIGSTSRQLHYCAKEHLTIARKSTSLHLKSTARPRLLVSTSRDSTDHHHHGFHVQSSNIQREMSYGWGLVKPTKSRSANQAWTENKNIYGRGFLARIRMLCTPMHRSIILCTYDFSHTTHYLSFMHV